MRASLLQIECALIVAPLRPTALLAVLLLHLLLLAAWRTALYRPTVPLPAARAVTYLHLPPAAPIEQRPVVVEAPPAPARAVWRRKPRPPTRAVETVADTPTLQAITLPPTAADPASAPLPAEPRLLDTPATRQALRELAPRHGAAAPGLSANDRLGLAIGRGATGDCPKGEYAGAGLGLLSAPFLALAALRGDCRR
jgi:hypothetical protein